MIWSLVALGAIGILLGFTFRAAALLAATFVTIVVCIAVEAASGTIGWQTLLLVFGMVLLLQCTYLVGVAFGVLWRRRGSSP